MDITAIDIVFTLTLIASIPVLANVYLKSGYFSKESKRNVVIGGAIWMIYVLFAEYASNKFLNLPWMDAAYHWHWATIVRDEISRGNWQYFIEYFKTGNSAYHCYSALILLAGGTLLTLTGINAFLAFWGGLILASCMASVCPFPRRSQWVLPAVIFFPSVVFWCTVNLKEAMMYWAICNIFSLGFPQRAYTGFVRIPMAMIGIGVGALMRPHVAMGWVAAVGIVTILRSGKRTAGIFLILCMPVVVFSLRSMLQTDFSLDVSLQTGETFYKSLQNIQYQGSAIENKGGRPIFLLSGIAAAYFRPFPWEARSFRSLVGALETWSLTLFMFYSWYSLNRQDKLFALKLPCMQVAILASGWMCLLLSYFPNEGLVMRQKVQLIPAMLVMTFLPLMIRKYAISRLEAMRRQEFLRELSDSRIVVNTRLR